MRKLNLHKLVQTLNTLCNNLQDQYNINYGGCCFLAYEIAKHLDKLHIEYRLCIKNDFPLNNFSINNEIKNRTFNKLGGSHSVTRYNTCCHYYLFINRGGFINPGNVGKYYIQTISGINYKHIKWIYNTGSWNDNYDIRSNKFIKKAINSYFKQYEKIYSN